MTAPNDSAGFFGGGAPSAKFPEGAYNTTIGGIIVEPPKMEQQRDYDDGKPQFYEDTGAPMMQLVVTVQTDQRDPQIPDDDGQRRFFVKGAMKAAVGQALRKAGRQQLDVGGALYVTYTHDGEQANPRLKPPKQFTAVYQPPATEQAQFLGGAAAQPAAVTQAAPAAVAPAPAPQYAQPPVQQYAVPAPAPQYVAPAAPVAAPQAVPQAVPAQAPVAAPQAVPAGVPAGLPPEMSPEAAAALASLTQPQGGQQ